MEGAFDHGSQSQNIRRNSTSWYDIASNHNIRIRTSSNSNKIIFAINALKTKSPVLIVSSRICEISTGLLLPLIRKSWRSDIFLRSKEWSLRFRWKAPVLSPSIEKVFHSLFHLFLIILPFYFATPPQLSHPRWSKDHLPLSPTGKSLGFT